ncbi:MAG: L-lactate dehydrogenase [Bacillota bacterium]
MERHKSKIAIIGAGFVGASTAYTIATLQLVQDLVLIDVNREKAIGEAMDISHGLCHMGQMNVRVGDYSDCANADIIIMTAGLNRKPGETRLDLAKRNIPIAIDITKNVMKYYTQGVFLVVSNPVDVLTYIIQRQTDLPIGRVMGTGTALDSARFRTLLSERLNVDIRNVHGYMAGEHGDAMLPLWSCTNVAGQLVDDAFKARGLAPLSEQEKVDLIAEVKSSGADVIKFKGATHFAIAAVTANICQTILKNQNTVKTVSTIIDGKYGINDVALSLPSVVNRNGVEQILDVKMTNTELDDLAKCTAKMKDFLNKAQTN